jgi:hypothetical protein
MPYKDPDKQAEYLRNYRTDYMRDYRAKQQKSRETAKELADYVTNTVINNEIYELILEKYPMKPTEYASILHGVTGLVNSECPNNTPEEITAIVNAHLIHYYRTGFIETILNAFRHPSLSLVFPFDSHVKEWLKAKEKELDKE